MVLEEGGRRYEPGSLNLPGIEGMRASLELLEGLGRPEITAYVLNMAGRIQEGARNKGFEIYGKGEGARAITSLREPKKGWGNLEKKMEAAQIRVSWRREHEGTMLLRVSPHISNTAEEVDEFLKVLGRAD
jgi:selenocysteine lyase/cysteine desulfurase